MKFSQHFLIDERVAERQIKYANLQPDDVVLEIGAGNGILTRKIAKVAKVIAIEIDEKFIEKLNKIKNVDVIHGDALKVDFNKLDFNKVISNIPYHISSPLTFKLLNSHFDQAILMYQKEFAERMVAKAGSRQYSRLSVMVYYRADCEILEYVPCHAFRPTPKVDSCIVRLKPIGRRFEVKEELFEKVTRALFSHRRKKIKNALLMEGIVSKENIDALPFIEERVEHLTPEEIAELVKKIEEIK